MGKHLSLLVSGQGSNTACKAGAFQGHSCLEYWCIIVSICALCFCTCCYVLSMLSESQNGGELYIFTEHYSDVYKRQILLSITDLNEYFP